MDERLASLEAAFDEAGYESTTRVARYCPGRATYRGRQGKAGRLAEDLS